ncbi:unnamed protein product [Blepharisma stoltei]|uniref:RING-type domain-containing protein n=1 Tax=Blepharisma stoltei TaxID=1481888 RepID=A0AAU9KEX3_9CILI|nr:unnamed protein product [Blepharisma stoltei]
MPTIRLSCNDVFIGLAIFYAGAELVIAWSDFQNCSKPIHIWLLISCLFLGLFRLVHSMGDPEVDEINEPWCFKLFTSNSNLRSCIVVGVLYPFFLCWILLGTFWYAEVDSDDYKLSGIEGTAARCFKDQQQSWYFILWLMIFYVWIIAYTTSIMISAMVYFRNLDIRGQYVRLAEQYGDDPVPRLSPHLQGLSPGSILRFEVETIKTPEANINQCTVCLEDFKAREKVRVMPCKHRFHLQCIDVWLMRQGSCPNCKRNLRTNSEAIPLIPI